MAAGPYKLFAVDLDGTLLDRAGTPHEVDRRALISLQRAGVEVTIVTGRLYAGSKLAADALGLTGPLACADGSHIVVHQSGESLFEHRLEQERMAMVQRALAPASTTSTFLFDDQSIVYDQRGQLFVPYMRTWSEQLLECDDVLAHPLFDRGDIIAIAAIGPDAEVHGARDALHLACDEAGLPRVQIATFPIDRLPGQFGLLARREGTDKGTALRWLAEHHRLSLEECVCVGDWRNDIPMFNVAGRSFVMGHAADDIKALATDVLEATGAEGGGIAAAARACFPEIDFDTH